MSNAPSPELASRGLAEREPLDARRRRQLIEATISSIASHGLPGTTVARVARIAGLSPGIVAFYFKNKDGLLRATLTHVDEEYTEHQVKALARVGDDPVRRLEALVEATFDPVVCNPKRVAVWAAFWGEARAREDYMRVCGRHEAEAGRRVIDLFEQVAQLGSYTQLDAAALGQAFYQLLASLPEDLLAAEQPYDSERAKVTCRGFLSSVFPAEFAHRPSPQARRHSDPGARVRPARQATLPARVYRDPGIHEIEKQHVFLRHWVLVGHASEAPSPGDYLTLDVGDDRAFVIRGGDGALRAFHNVCRHRAARVVRGDAGRCDGAIVCPHHGWRYALTGELRDVPDPRAFPDLDRAGLALPAIELSEWHGFLFVRIEGNGATAAELLRPFDAEARVFRFEEMQPLGRRWSRLGDFNWKVFVENDSGALAESSAESSAPGDAERASGVLLDARPVGWSEALYRRLLPTADHLPPALRRVWLEYRLFPTSVLAVTPDGVAARQVLPDGPERSLIHGFSVGLPDARREMRAARYLSHRITRSALRANLEVCRSADRGLRSSSHRGGVLSENESRVRRFHDRIRELLSAAR